MYGEGGATYGDPALTGGDTDAYFAPYTAAEFSAMLQTENITWLLVAKADEGFVTSYHTLFTDDLAAAESGPALYKVTAEGFVPAGTLQKEAGA